jgi:6-phosphogluconolactonase/glucosamine-6-phosphate isomerase/deaminase
MANLNEMKESEIMLIEGSKEHLAQKAASILNDTIIRLLKEKENVVLALPGGSCVDGIF